MIRPKETLRIYGKGRQSAGFGQKSFLEEEHAVAVRLYGRSFIEHHLEAIREGRTKRTLRDLINAKLSK